MYANIRAFLDSKKNRIEDSWKKRPIIMDWLEYGSMGNAISIIDHKVGRLKGVADGKLNEWFLSGDKNFCSLTAERYIVDHLRSINKNVVDNLVKTGGPDAILKCPNEDVGIEITTVNGFIADWIFTERLLLYLKEKVHRLHVNHQITYDYELLNTELNSKNYSSIYDYIESVGDNIRRGDETALQKMQVTWQKTDSEGDLIIWEHDAAQKFPTMKYLTEGLLSHLQKSKTKQLSRFPRNIVMVGVNHCGPNNHLTPRIFNEMGNGSLSCQYEIEYISNYWAKNLPNSIVGLCYYIYDIGQETPFYPLRMFWRDENHRIDINL